MSDGYGWHGGNQVWHLFLQAKLDSTRNIPWEEVMRYTVSESKNAYRLKRVMRQAARRCSAVPPLRPCIAAMAVACAFAAAPSAAQITTSGTVFTTPGVFPVGPGDTDIGNNALFVGDSGNNGALGTLNVTGGGLLRVWGLSIASGGGTSPGNGVVDISGAGTRVELTGDSTPGVMSHLSLGSWGIGKLTVSGGAVLDGTVNIANCQAAPGYQCANLIAYNAGSEGVLTVTGPGSQASFQQHLFVGGISVARPPVEGFTAGTPGGTSHAVVQVLDGAKLNTGLVEMGMPPGGSGSTGRERSFVEVLISGADSVWTVNAFDPLTGYPPPRMGVSDNANSWTTIRVENGGKLRFAAANAITAQFNGLILTGGGGRSDMVVTGIGSSVDFNGGELAVGGQLGTANLDVLAGGRLNDLSRMEVANNGSIGSMTIDGAGSAVTVNKQGKTAPVGAPAVEVGDNSTGTLTVRNGGRLDIVNVAASTRNAPNLILGLGSGTGQLNIDGSGSVVSLSSLSILPGGGSGEARNPFVAIGYEGLGGLTISNGGKLLVTGNAISTSAAARNTVVNIGGANDTTPGGYGIALIDGPGSELRLEGNDRFVGVGRSPGSTGQLIMTNQALVTSTVLSVGRSGGVGILRMDNARIELSGQYVGSTLAGAGLQIGTNGGIGSANLGNGSRIIIANLGSAGANINVGGSANFPLGDGTLTLQGGSRIEENAAPGMASMNVGRDGSGLVRVREASSIDLGDGNLYVGRLPGSDGTMILTDNSTVTAGYVGVGRNKTGNGGTGTFVVASGSTLTANTIEIGPNGFLGGNGTIVGDITNYGIVSPGNSPGTMTIDGSFINAAGGRIFLEIESDGAGGFNTDQLIFAQGSNVDLAGVDIRFYFLGGTDPNAFQASGLFDIGTFLKQETTTGITPLDDNEFTGVTFSAKSDAFVFQSFVFDPSSGAIFTTAPVPEPSQWVLMIAGTLFVLDMTRRRRRSCRSAIS
jgi:T5SS/PEP-CTERM-associated repeat protein